MIKVIGIPTTIAEFAEACKDLSNEEIYCLFEEDISDELRDKIYDLAEKDCNEPCRDALIKIGTQYSIQSLIDY